MNVKVLFVFTMLTIFSLFYLAGHNENHLNLQISSEKNTTEEISSIAKEAYFYGIDSNFFRGNSPDLYKKNEKKFNEYSKAKFWGINIISE